MPVLAVGSTVIGWSTQSNTSNTVAIGTQAKTNSALSGVAVGYIANASNSYAIALGGYTVSNGANSIALGRGSNAANESSIAIGAAAICRSGLSISIGSNAGQSGSMGSSQAAVSIGLDTRTGPQSIAIGSTANASVHYGLALGRYTSVTANYGIAIGGDAATGSVNSIAIGRGATVGNNGANSVAVGSGVSVNVPETIQLGTNTHTIQIPGNLTVNGTVIGNVAATNTTQTWAGYGNTVASTTDTVSLLVGGAWANTSVLPQYSSGKKFSAHLSGNLGSNFAGAVTLLLR